MVFEERRRRTSCR